MRGGSVRPQVQVLLPALDSVPVWFADRAGDRAEGERGRSAARLPPSYLSPRNQGAAGAGWGAKRDVVVTLTLAAAQATLPHRALPPPSSPGNPGGCRPTERACAAARQAQRAAAAAAQ